jgi:ParB/RepB/Spo0J family partition protein
MSTVTQTEANEAAGVVAASAEYVPSVYENHWLKNPGQVMEVNINELDVDADDDVRIETASADDKSKEFKQFVAAVEQNGYQPIEVRIIDGRLKVDEGRRRLAALKALGRTTARVLPANDNGVGVSRSDAIRRALAFNVARKDLNPIEKMLAVVKIQKAVEAEGGKITNAQIAKDIGVSAASISGYLSLQKYDEEAQALIVSGKVGYGAALALIAELGDMEKASTQLKALVAQADDSSDGKQVRRNTAKKAARKANEAAGRSSNHALTTSEAIAMLDKYSKDFDKKSADSRICYAIKTYIRGLHTVKQTLETIAKAWQ